MYIYFRDVDIVMHKTIDMEELWTTSDAARLSGVTKDMLNYFQRSGIFVAREAHLGTRGKPRAYDFVDLILLSALGELASAGVSVLRLSVSLTVARRALKRSGKRSLSHRYLVTNGERTRLLKAGDSCRMLGTLGGAAVLVDMERLAREVQARIAA